ncbi:MAG: outer membrane lipoprotein carrier protein LolA [Thermoanaerobaculales bacterium]
MMRRAFGAFFFLVPLPLFAQEGLPPNLHGADKLAALVQRVSQIQAGITTLTAGFEQTKTSHLLVAPSVSRGKFYYQAPDKLRWEYETPRPMTVLLAGGVATTYRPAEKRAERVEIGRMQRRIFRFLSAAEPLEKLKGNFIFTFRDPGGTANYSLLLLPTTHAIKKRMKSVEVIIDRRSLLPVAVTYVESDGDTTGYSFSNIELNKPQPPELYTLTLPPDVEMVHINLGNRD